MRSSYHDKSWITISDDDTNVIGINLGYDRCSEHEWGIKPILSQMGVTPGRGLGIERHRIRQTPEGLTFTEFKMKGKGRRSRKIVRLATLSLNNYPEHPVQALPFALSSPEEDDSKSGGHNLIGASWDEQGFVVTVMGADNVARLKQIHQAILAGDGCISLSSLSNPFSGSGLCLTIASKVPQEVAQNALQEDESAQRLSAAVNATGILGELEKANCTFYALSPQWTDKSETSIRFFLNPREQHRYNHGWMTVEDLRDWIRGEGKIIKKAG